MLNESYAKIIVRVFLHEVRNIQKDLVRRERRVRVLFRAICVRLILVKYRRYAQTELVFR